MIKIEHLTKIYKGDVTALNNISLEIGTGMFGLVGPNGAGKTSLMRIIAGLLHWTTGRVEVNGYDMHTLKGKQAAKAILGYLPQELGLYPHLTGAEFLDYVAILKGVTNRQQRKQQLQEALEKVHLTEVAGRRLKTYSGGMKRRIGIAQALIGNPRLMIVDEPTAGLDPEERVRLRNLFSELSENATVILSTHIIEDISQSCRDLAIMYNGTVLFRGAPNELIQKTRGQVWNIVTDGERPNHGLKVVSTLQLAQGTQYRVIGDAQAFPNAISTEPSLEDGYIHLMSQTRNRELA
ncbi:MAG: ABC transporter ATP-binding protein [Anaerolineae bacterium]|nr:MAG: ABC transporter ATP-binding protein [Anaerolineae bacterium]